MPYGSSHTFDFEMTAPAAPGDYLSDWRMATGERQFFGAVAEESIHVVCTPVVAWLAEPIAAWADDGATISLGSIHEYSPALAPVMVIVPSSQQSGDSHRISGLRAETVSGPVRVSLPVLAPQEIPPAGSLTVQPLIAPIPGRSRSALEPFEVLVAFEVDSVPYSFRLEGEVQRASFGQVDCWDLTIDDYGGHTVYEVDRTTLPQDFTFDVRVRNCSASETLKVPSGGFVWDSSQLPTGFTATFTVGCASVDPSDFSCLFGPGESESVATINLTATPDAESGELVSRVSVFPDNAGSQSVPLDGRFEIESFGLGLDNVLVDVQFDGGAPLSNRVGDGGTVDVGSVRDQDLQFDFSVLNFNSQSIHVDVFGTFLSGAGAGGLDFEHTWRPGDIPAQGQLDFEGVLRVAGGQSGPFLLRLDFTVFDRPINPFFSEDFTFYIRGDRIICGGSPPCGAILEVVDEAGLPVRALWRAEANVGFEQEFEFTVRNEGDQLLELDLPITSTGDSRFTLSNPSDAAVAVGAERTFSVSFDARGASPSATYETTLVIASNSAIRDPFDFTIRVAPLPLPPFEIEVIGYDVQNFRADLGTHSELPLELIFKLTGNSDDRIYFGRFRGLLSQGGPLQWTWADPAPPLGLDVGDHVALTRNETYFFKGYLNRRSIAGNLNQPFSLEIQFVSAESRTGANPTTHQLDLVGSFEGLYNPVADGPNPDCSAPSHPCDVAFCAQRDNFLAALPGEVAACLANSVVAAYSCKSCGIVPFVPAPPLVAQCVGLCFASTALAYLGCDQVTQDTWVLWGQILTQHLQCYCDRDGRYCEREYFVGYEVEGLGPFEQVALEAQCRTPGGFEIFSGGTATHGAPVDYGIIRCPEGATVTLGTLEVDGVGDHRRSCRLLDPQPGDLPAIPLYERFLSGHFSGAFDCSCQEPLGCGTFHQVTGTAQGLREFGDEIEVALNPADEPGAIIATVTENGVFSFPGEVPTSSFYSVAIVNKDDYPHCWVEPTRGNIAGGPVVDVVDLFCDTTVPNVTLTAPRDGFRYTPDPGTGTIPLRAIAGDVERAPLVQLYVDDEPVSGWLVADPVDAIPFYEVLWLSSGPGTYEARALARNLAGATAWSRTSTFEVDSAVGCDVDGEGPEVIRLTPADGAAVVLDLLRTVLLDAQVFDLSGVQQVEFLIDDQPVGVAGGDGPWSFGWRAPGTGSFRLRIRSTDNCGNVSESQEHRFTVVEANPELPYGFFEPATCQALTGWSTDPNFVGAVKVQFFRGAPRPDGELVAEGFADRACGSGGGLAQNNCFAVATPAVLRTGGAESVYAYARDVDPLGVATGQWRPLFGSPQVLTCGGGSGGGGAAPPTPLGLAASDGAFGDRVRVTWTPSAGATAYEVLRGTTSDVAAAAVIAVPVGATVDDQDVVVGQTYHYWARATNGHGSSVVSQPNTGFAAAGTGSTDPPTGEFEEASCTRLVGWAHDPDSAAPIRVRIYRDGPLGIGVLFADVLANRERSGLPTPGSRHGFEVAVPTGTSDGTLFYAYGVGVNASGQPDGLDAPLPPLPRAVDCPQNSRPSAPTELSASDGAFGDRVRLQWSPASNAQSYSVHRSSTSSPLDGSVVAAGLAGTSWNDTTAVPWQTYHYWVFASNGHGNSAFSNVDTGYAGGGGGASPQGTFDEATCEWLAGWAWDPDFAGPIRVRVFRDGPLGIGSLFAEVVADRPRASLPAPDPNHGFRVAIPAGTSHGTLFYAYAVGVDGSGQGDGEIFHLVASPQAVQCSQTTRPDAPTGVTASDGAFADRVRVTWQASPTATSYSVWRHTSHQPMSGNVVASGVEGTSWDDLSAPPGQAYYYWVFATNEHGSSAFSSPDLGFVSP